MKNIRFVKYLVCLLASLSLLTACGSPADSQPEAPAPQQEQTEQVSAPAGQPPAPQNLIPFFPLAMDYLGMGVVFDNKVMEMGQEGSLFMDVETSISVDMNIEAVMLNFHLVPEAAQNTPPATLKEFKEKWLPSTDRAGVLGVYSPAYLEEHPLDELTQCTAHQLIGSSPDGSLVYYMSTNTIEGSDIDRLLLQTNIDLWEPAPFPVTGSFDLLGEARSSESYIGDFEAESLSHGTITPEIFSDYDLTMVNVFATWCSPCLHEIPFLAEIDKEMAEQSVNVIGIVMDVNERGSINEKTKQKALAIAEKSGAEYEILIPDSILLEGHLHGITAIPETFFVDKNGNIVGNYYVGARSKKEWVKIIETELAGLSSAEG